jgi:hypothetical protein
MARAGNSNAPAASKKRKQAERDDEDNAELEAAHTRLLREAAEIEGEFFMYLC